MSTQTNIAILRNMAAKRKEGMRFKQALDAVIDDSEENLISKAQCSRRLTALNFYKNKMIRLEELNMSFN